MSQKRAARIIECLGVDDVVKQNLLTKIGVESNLAESLLKSGDEILLTDWTYSAICMSYDLPLPLRSPKKIAKRLGISVELVEKVSGDLICRGFLQKKENGEIARPSVMLRANEGLTMDVIVRFHMDSLNLARKALLTVSKKHRDY